MRNEGETKTRGNVLVIDAGVGNLGNVARAMEHLGARPRLSDHPRDIAAARTLILPGVGAFKPPRERLRGAREEALAEALEAGAKLLGICVGYQILFSHGEEFETTDGLGHLPGEVVRLSAGVPLPHIGWNQLVEEKDHPLLAGIPGGSHVYFVHSFAARAVPEELCLAKARHGDLFPAVVGRGKIFGTQFHPEKSGEHGLRLLANFLDLSLEDACN